MMQGWQSERNVVYNTQTKEMGGRRTEHSFWNIFWRRCTAEFLL